jgi:phytoene dehydrogenase-like protein
MARGGSQLITEAMAAHLRQLGGEIVTSHPVESIDELPPARAVLFDVAPRGLVAMAGHRLPDRYRRALERYRYGPGVFKLDWALDGPIPWTASDCGLAASERAVARGEHAERPYVLLAQQSLFDATRAPAGRHTAWAYCHVPNGSTVDMTERIEGQIERFAPGFRDLILERHALGAMELERYNPNYVGGDINAGLQDLRQHFTRPVARPIPYATPLKGVYICSASTPPGGGVHGMCGYLAARAALRREW